MRIGVDIDGVLANFIPAYQQLVVKTTGRDDFHPGDNVNAPCWNWPELRGYSVAEMSVVWAHIKSSPDFWLSLGECPGCSTLRLLLPDLSRHHDIYYITSRPGHDAKWQTEMWLQFHLIAELPTVLISNAKGRCCQALQLDVYVDDNLDNALDVVAKSPTTRCYLLDASYNRLAVALGPPPGIRIPTLGAMFDLELANL